MQTINDKRKVLGRGLDALLPSRHSGASASASGVAPMVTAPPASAHAQVSGEANTNVEAGPQEIPLELIDRNPYQTRGKHDEATLEELAASIRVAGVIQPVVLRPVVGVNGDVRYQMMAGVAARGQVDHSRGHTPSL